MSTEHVRAWRPDVPGVGEVLHAHFTEHAYPAHTHQTWTVLLVDTGGVSYDLERRPHAAEPGSLTLLPPFVPHDGKAASASGFDKRVLYLDERWLPHELVGAAVDRPTVADVSLRRSLGRLHANLARPGDELEAESRLSLISERLRAHLRGIDPASTVVRERTLAHRVRSRLEHDLAAPPTIEQLASELGVHSTHVIRAFSREFGLPPHRYVTGRRIDRARSLLLDGMAAADVAVEVGFHDQSHLTRHFRRVLGVAPGAFARGPRPAGAPPACG